MVPSWPIRKLEGAVFTRKTGHEEKVPRPFVHKNYRTLSLSPRRADRHVRGEISPLLLVGHGREARKSEDGINEALAVDPFAVDPAPLGILAFD